MSVHVLLNILSKQEQNYDAMINLSQQVLQFQ